MKTRQAPAGAKPSKTHQEMKAKLLAAASSAAYAAGDIVEAVRDTNILSDNVGDGTTLNTLADGLRLLIEATPPSAHDAKTAILKGALEHFLDLPKTSEPTQ